MKSLTEYRRAVRVRGASAVAAGLCALIVCNELAGAIPREPPMC